MDAIRGKDQRCCLDERIRLTGLASGVGDRKNSGQSGGAARGAAD